MIYAVVNQKGGVGKTVTTQTLARAFNLMGKSVLMVDLDPQASLTVSLGISPESLNTSMYHVLSQGVPYKEALLSIEDNYDLLPATIDLALSEQDMNMERFGQRILRQVINKAVTNYDVVLIDCPPSLGMLTINALVAADEIIAPVACEYLSYRGVKLLMQTTTRIQKEFNPELSVAVVIPTFYSNTIHCNEVLDKLKEEFDELVSPVIYRSIRVPDATLGDQTILDTDPDHKISLAYKNIAKELMANG